MADNTQMMQLVSAIVDVLGADKYGDGRMANEERAKALERAGEAFDAMVDVRVREILVEVTNDE
jgi:hypothetical protein